MYALTFMKTHDAEGRDAFGIWGLSIETYARHNPREVAFKLLSPNMDTEAVCDALKHHVSAFHFLLYRMPQELFGLLHEYIMWSIDQPCTDVAAEVALKNNCYGYCATMVHRPIHLGLFMQGGSQRGARPACGSVGLLDNV